MSVNPASDVYQSRVFSKTFNRLSDKQQCFVDDEIEKIINNPELGQRKKGDLSHLYVHKFTMEQQLYLLGYSWLKEKLTLYLLNIGSHQNFYIDAKKRRKADLKLIK